MSCLLCVFVQVSDVYLMVQQTMAQPLMKDYVPFSWASMVQVKAEHFRALSHYYAAVALCDHTCKMTPHTMFHLGRPSSSRLKCVIFGEFKQRNSDLKWLQFRL